MDPRNTAEEFARELASVFGPRLRSVMLHGSVARGEAVPGVSDINVLVLLDRVDPQALMLASPAAKRWTRAGNSAPLLMSWAEWQESADAFAIEISDMRAAREVLRGEDPVAALPEDRAALRLQAERELRGKLAQLRTGLLLSAGDAEQTGRLLLTALPSVTTYLRTVLRLADRPAEDGTPSVIRGAAALCGFDPESLLRCWTARSENRPLALRTEDPVTTGYAAAVVRAVDYVDSLPEATQP